MLNPFFLMGRRTGEKPLTGTYRIARTNADREAYRGLQER